MCSFPNMEQITLRVPETLKEELEREAEDRGVSRSEYVRNVLESWRDTERLQDRLEARENRIQELESQLARRSQIEEKIDTLAKRDSQPDPPWPVRWYRWARGSA